MAIRIGPTGQRFDLVERTTRDHSPKAREVLRRAGLSMESELTVEQARKLNEFTEAYDNPQEVPGHQVRFALFTSLRGEGNDGIGAAAIRNASPTKGESIMAKAKSSTKKSAPTKAQIATIARMRRDGATWDEVISETEIRTNSTGFRELLESAGFDKYGRKGGQGKSKAKGWGSAAEKAKSNGSTKSTPKGKGKVRRVKRTKATAKK